MSNRIEATDLIGNKKHPEHRRGTMFFIARLLPDVRREENRRLEKFETSRVEQERVNICISDFIRDVNNAIKNNDRRIIEKTIELGKAINVSEMSQLPNFQILDTIVANNEGKLLFAEVKYRNGDIRMSEGSKKYKLIVTW